MTIRIYLFEDGDIGYTENEPTEGDLNAVEGGTLEILEIEGEVKFVANLQTDGSKLDLQRLELTDVAEYRYYVLPPPF